MSDIEAAKSLFFAGITCLDSRDFANAGLRFRDALKLVPNSVPVLTNLSTALFAQQKHGEALAFAEQAILADVNNIDAHLIAANCLMQERRFVEAHANLDKAIALEPSLTQAYNNRAVVSLELRNWEDALADCERAIRLEPDFADAYSNRASALNKLKRHEEALASYDKAISLRPDFAIAWLGYGNVFSELKRFDEALAAYDKALTLLPHFAEAWLSRGNVFATLRRRDEALAAFDRALALKSSLPHAWLGRAHALLSTGKYNDAFAAYDHALTLESDLNYAEGGRIHAKQQLCNWTNFDAEVSQLLVSVRAGKPASVPFTLLSVTSSSAEQLQCATTCISLQPAFPAIWCGEHYFHDRIRIAYLSPDFRDHPVAHAAVGMFESHNKSKFEITAISLGPEQDSDIRRRVKNSFEYFIDAEALNDHGVAEQIRSREIDIAVDLTGFTQGFRLDILARRPAPVQVNFLGYASTMGADYIDYIIADSTVVPEKDFSFFKEKVIWLPDSFMPTDLQHPASENTPTRRDFALPEQSFVFCCFNNTYKITPVVFHIWMRLLKAIDDSVLWLAQGNPTATQNLRREAAAYGVAPERLIFASRVASRAAHLARQPLADLFLDTVPYNAHATASDALRGGLPVLTFLGDTFAGRVGASQLKAVGLADLITASLEDYEAFALRLAHDPPLLRTLKDRLVRNRDIFPLFDTVRITRHIESAYMTMWERQQRGEPPQAFVVEPAP